MSQLDDVVSVLITANTASPTKEGFGVPMIVASFTLAGFTNRVRTYKKPSDLTADGFSASSPLYRAAVMLCSQKNKVPQFKVGRRTAFSTQNVQLTCTSAVQGDVYTIDITPQGGAKTTITRTVPGSSSTSAEATAIAALIDALPQITATAVGAVITVVTTSNLERTTFENWSTNLRFKDSTSGTGCGSDLTTDLDAILAEDNDWYGLILDSESEAETDTVAAWAETNVKLFCASTSDWGCTDSVTTTDVMSDIAGSSYTHTVVLYNGKRAPHYGGAGWMGGSFPYEPGSRTWQLKSIAGLPVDSLSTSQKNAIVAKKGNYFVPLSGVNVTQGGAKVGSGEYIDIIHGLDWLKAEIQYDVFLPLLNNDKVPFDDDGIAVVQAAVLQALAKGVENKLLAKSPAPTVDVPKASAVSAADKLARTLKNVTFTATLAGAIHMVNVSGTVSV